MCINLMLTRRQIHSNCTGRMRPWAKLNLQHLQKVVLLSACILQRGNLALHAVLALQLPINGQYEQSEPDVFIFNSALGDSFYSKLASCVATTATVWSDMHILCTQFYI